MTTERKCTDCGRAIAYSKGRPASRCGECKRGRRRIIQRSEVVCVDCQTTFLPPGHTGVPPKRCEPCRVVRLRATNTEKTRRYRERHPDRVLEQSRRYSAAYLSDPENLKAKRDRELRRVYGLTRAELDVLIAKQNGKCAICGGGPRGKGDRLHIDHCHASKAIRGLLCSNCNTMLGLAADDPARLKAAAAYLERTAT